ncbi:ubiquitin fusion degradation protein 1 homolog isoform X2 [Leguminivora glycinivorella]|uniref:ubiquitin fusion degradation protein 1 homolog isoform X2 n=1 Tax=Leguminivora glycinivorella TaxID=1035111 RepID=UPI00200C4F1F|nr:ubiquitin fusion degradation protein 1 homolog isoform X2 [Leguminivora glycinivorella]XP_048006853.1 ubiquitin fusion degradation protein 1 homolog isoform X2 [Leguminivora glycinivorella]
MFGFNMFHEISRPFNMSYRCFSVSMLPGNERQDVERGGKIIMPPSALEQLTRLNIEYPMIFKLTNKKSKRSTHCGVLEFVADEGKVYLPHWMMANLVMEEGTLLQIESVSLPVATFSKFKPLSEDFLDISNPKAVLENCLRNFSCLTTGDVIAIKYNSKVYELCVLETKPGNAVIIIECDMNVEFESPVGYKEEERTSHEAQSEAEQDPAALMPEPSGFVPFKGEGNRLDGKKKKLVSESDSEPAATSRQPYVRGIPDYEYEIGTIRFIRTRPSSAREETPIQPFEAFKGEGFTLRTAKSN